MGMRSLHSKPSDFSVGLVARQAALLLLVSLLIAAGSWLLRSDSLSWQADPTTYELELSAPLVELADALILFEEGDHLFMDTRRDAAEAEETISDAFILREASFDNDLLALMDDVYPEDPILLFGNGELTGVSNVAARLQQRGYENVSILRVGVKGWKKAGGLVSAPTILEAWDDSGETP